MPLNLEKLQSWPMTESVHRYEDRDTMLYALGVGMGSDPVDPRQLAYVFERDLRVIPTMATILGARFPWLRDPESGINLKKMLHGESGVVAHRSLPSAGTVVSRVRIKGIVDRGAEKGATVYFEHAVHDAEGADLLATVTGCFVFRDGGGCGGTGFAPPAARPVPTRVADASCEMPTLAQAGLLYRLTGDRNPLHADPEIARGAGFERPILHGSCTYGIAARALLATRCDYDASRLRRFDVRFSAPMYPGETLRTEIWDEGNGLHLFRCSSVQRDVVVLSNGSAEIAEAL